jgi:MFS family permease
MTATPLAIMACGYSFDHAASVIQWHVLAMFVPSFFTGNLINRFGAINIILAGVGLNIIAMIAHTTGSTYAHFWTGLVTIGLGWNFMFIGGTSMLTEFCRPCERTKVQALNDVMVFGSIAVASLLSGALYSLLDWTAVNMVLILPIVLVLGAIWHHAYSATG